MTKTMIALFALPLAALVTPVAAQEDAGDRVNMVIAFDESECPERTTDNEIVVCQILVEADRYRIPEPLRYSDDPSNTAWAQRVQAFRFVGDFGALSCSPTGAAGFTGCSQQMIEAAYEAREGGSAVRFSQLIAQAREERMATIDEDAAAEQERVEQIEREYQRRLEAERAAEIDQQALPQPETSGDD